MAMPDALGLLIGVDAQPAMASDAAAARNSFVFIHRLRVGL
jgi:hypothetical protein